jgi:hypothetical protein
MGLAIDVRNISHYGDIEENVLIKTPFPQGPARQQPGSSSRRRSGAVGHRKANLLESTLLLPYW